MLSVLVALRVDAPARHAALLDLADRRGAVLAYLQVGDPALTTVLDRAAGAGETAVSLERVPDETGKPGRSWLRRVAGDWSRRHPDVEVTVDGRAATGTEAPLRSAAWERVPPFRHHVLVCRGRRCAARGAEQVGEEIAAALRERDLGDDDVLVTQTGCLYPCNHAPVVAVHPDGAWYGPVDAAVARAIVAEHLDGDDPLTHHRLDGRPPAT